MTERTRQLILGIAIIVPIVVVFGVFDRYPQPLEYFAFADERSLLGLPNFWNVVSNLAFLAIGLLGLWRLRTKSLQIIEPLTPAYYAFFVGIVMTAFGSAWFHLDPGNATLTWDRLPMTIAFMSLFAIVIGEHVSERLAEDWLGPLLLFGAISVFYWAHTEQQGAGDLRLYGLVQFLPMLLIPLILLMYPSRFDRIGFFWVVIGIYILAKVFELFDTQVYLAGNIVSGHTLKHIVAAIAPLVLLRGLKRRAPK